jgi:NADPH2:quinone reductase
VKALQATSLTGPSALELVEVPAPARVDGTVLIDVQAAGVSFVDLLLTRGEYQIRVEAPFIPGIEVAGVVREAPPDSELDAGQRVVAIAPLGGGFAEAALAPLEFTYPAPESLSPGQGAALTINYCTALFALRRRGRLSAGETVLVHGAAGGVGTAAVQIAKASGARVVAVASSPDKAAVAREAGADEVLDAGGDWQAQVRELTDSKGADVVFDPVGGERLAASLRCLAPEGRLLVVGFADGTIPSLSVNRVLLRHADIVGVNWGGFFMMNPGYARECVAELARLADDGLIRPLVGRAYSLADGPTALRDLAERRATGKLVIEVR